jgi:hypothetical protein
MRCLIVAMLSLYGMAVACHAEYITMARDNASNYTNATWSGDLLYNTTASNAPSTSADSLP